MTLGNRLNQCIIALDLNQRKLAELCQWDKPARVSHYINNRRPPSLKDIEVMAIVLKCTPEWLAYGTGTPPKYLFHKNPPADQIPVIAWNLVKSWHKTYNIEALFPYSNAKSGISSVDDPASSLRYVSVFEKKNDKQFAMEIKGDSMISPVAGRRSFLESDVIIIDPDVPPKSGDFVVALQQGSCDAIFKQYIKDGSSRFLRPLNPQYPLIQLDESIEICGVVVAHLDVLV